MGAYYILYCLHCVLTRMYVYTVVDPALYWNVNNTYCVMAQRERAVLFIDERQSIAFLSFLPAISAPTQHHRITGRAEE